MQVQGTRDHRRAHDARSRASAIKYTTENECVKFHGILKREECVADFRQACKFKVEEQDKHDIALDKLSVREYEDPFKGGK